MTIKALYPTVRPTLNLDFAKTKALDPRVTFSRASTGTFVGSNGLIQTAASGAARFDHNPATGESLGLLVEEARTSLLLYSEQLDNAAWSKTNLTVASDAAISPSGLLNGDTVVPSATDTYKSLDIGIGVSTGVTYTLSFFAKPAGYNFLVISQYVVNNGGDGANCVLDLVNGVITASGPRGGFTLALLSKQSFPNGWARFSLSFSFGLNNSSAFRFCPVPTGTPTIHPANSSDIGRPIFTGDGTSGVSLWGAQVEAGAFPTSYIPTVASTVTRAADVASMTGTNFSSWYNNNQGTYFLNAVTLNGSTATNTTQDNLIDDGYVYIQDYVGASVRRRVIAGASGAFNFNPAQAPSRRVAVAFDSSSANVAYNGILQSVDTTVSGLPNTASSLRIGATITGLALVDQGYITRLAYYPVRLPDAQLQALTAT